MVRSNRKIIRGKGKKSPVYFITFVTWSRLELNSAARQIVLDSCLFFNEQRYRIYALVVMGDHVHLLIQPFIKNNKGGSASILLASSSNHKSNCQLKNQSHLQSNNRLQKDINPYQNKIEYWSIGNILHSIKSYSAKQIPNVMNHIGKVWQDGRHDRRIRNQQELDIKWEYIRQNPVKAGLVKKAGDYPFLWEMF